MAPRIGRNHMRNQKLLKTPKPGNRYQDLTQGEIAKTMLLFSLPMIGGSLLQQLYNVVDALIVGRFLGSDPLAAVGSAFTLMTFLTSILLGLSMGAGALFAICWGQRDLPRLRQSVAHAFLLFLLITVALNVAVYRGIDPILAFLQVPDEVYTLMRDYLVVIFAGIGATFLYNFFACLLRSLGNSAVPLFFLGLASLLNIGLDLLFILAFHWGVRGAGAATVIAQIAAGVGLTAYAWVKCREVRPSPSDFHWNGGLMREISSLSLFTCAQQSVMNFGILLVQGLVNSFGAHTMAAFSAVVKIDAFAYMPVQEFGNAFSTFVAQNYGAGARDRIEKGISKAVWIVVVFCVVITAVVVLFAKQWMLLFIQPQETEILAIGVQYLRIEGSFYWGIGCLFLLYGFYRAIKKPAMSVVLTVISLGLRVLLAYVLADVVGVVGIWLAIPIGWMAANLTGLLYYFWKRKNFFTRGA